MLPETNLIKQFPRLAINIIIMNGLAAFMCFISYIQCNPHTKARAANDPCAEEIKKVVCDKHIIISTAIHVAWANEYKTVDQVE